MANDVGDQQLPIMVRRPKAVWSGLDRMDLQRKMIAGDGNCLFASLSDQLYGNSTQHGAIRDAIIQHMRDFRPLFENVAIKDDIQQKRATRARTNAVRKDQGVDQFEEYLSIMSKPGTYGGEPELVAFVQCFDQDVLIHLPRMPGYPETIPYTNQHRLTDAVAKPTLHLCYGGDEKTNAHYDSVRRSRPIVPILQQPDPDVHEISPTPSTSTALRTLTSRSIRNNRSDISKDMMHELVVRGTTDLKYALEHLNESERARSPSVSSSHNSNSSKRSLDDEGENHRIAKRADRRQSTKRIAPADITHRTMPSTNITVKLNAGLATPASTQDSEFSSDQSDRDSDFDKIKLRPRRRPVSRSLTPDIVTSVPEQTRRSSTMLNQSISAAAVTPSIYHEETHSALSA